MVVVFDSVNMLLDGPPQRSSSSSSAPPQPSSSPEVNNNNSRRRARTIQQQRANRQSSSSSSSSSQQQKSKRNRGFVKIVFWFSCVSTMILVDVQQLQSHLHQFIFVVVSPPQPPMNFVPEIPIRNDNNDHNNVNLNNNNNNNSFNDTTTITRTQNRLPQWFYDYTEWHTRTMQEMWEYHNSNNNNNTDIANTTNHNNSSDNNHNHNDFYNQYQYVLLRCVRNDMKCYGTSDRLKMIPVILKLAYQSQRLLFIHWSRPFALEEFLVPNIHPRTNDTTGTTTNDTYNTVPYRDGGLNWTVPHFLYNVLNVEATGPLWRLGHHSMTLGMMDESTQSIPVVRIMSMVYASQYYDTHQPARIDRSIWNTTTDTNDITIISTTATSTELPMWEVYSDFWNALFRPSPGVRQAIHTALNDLQLLVDDDDEVDEIDNDNDSTRRRRRRRRRRQQSSLIPNIHVKPYVSVHVRANYNGDTSMEHPEENAIRCAQQLQHQYQEYYYHHHDDNDDDSNSYSDTNGSSDNNHADIHGDRTTTSSRGSNKTNVIPIYIASDTSIVVEHAIQYGINHDLLVVSRRNQNNPYHLDQPPPTLATTTNDTNTVVSVLLQPSDFYDTFVDLYVLALGQCHTWGLGGYGSWAANIAIAHSASACSSIVHSKQQC